MRQLAGCACAKCQRTIDSVLEGKFCSDCGNAVHKDCIAPVADVPGLCPTCGSATTNPVAIEVRLERQEERNKERFGNHPVSRVCPSCGGVEFKTARPDRWVAFTQDRLCKTCGMRYTPPTPAWGGIALIATGLALLTLGWLGGIVCGVLLGVLGLLAVGHGIRSLIRPGKV